MTGNYITIEDLQKIDVKSLEKYIEHKIGCKTYFEFTTKKRNTIVNHNTLWIDLTQSSGIKSLCGSRFINHATLQVYNATIHEIQSMLLFQLIIEVEWSDKTISTMKPFNDKSFIYSFETNEWTFPEE